MAYAHQTTEKLKKYNPPDSTHTMMEPADGLMMPRFDELNKYASHQSSTDKHWHPIPELTPTRESIAFNESIKQCLVEIYQKTTKEQLELRANTPQYKVAADSWANINRLTGEALRAVTRLPSQLIEYKKINNEPLTQPGSSPKRMHRHRGWLLKKGRGLPSLQRRYFEMNGMELTYFKSRPEEKYIENNQRQTAARGSISVDSILNVQPSKQLPESGFAFDIITVNHTWTVVADSEGDYREWIDCICRSVKFNAVAPVYRRLLSLERPALDGIQEVRMVIATDDTVGEIIEHIFGCYKRNLGPENDTVPYEAPEFLLKVTGYREYFIDRDCSMGNYEYIRKCLLQKRTIKLTLVHHSHLQERASTVLQIRPSMELDENTPCDDSDDDAWELEDALKHNKEEANNVQPQPTIRSSAIDGPLKFSIIRVLNIPQTSLSMHRDHGGESISHTPLSSNFVQLHTEVFFCGKKEPMFTFTSELYELRKSPQGFFVITLSNEVIEIPLNISELPLASRLVFTLYNVQDNRHFQKLATTGVQIFTVDSELVQGDVYLGMYSNLYEASCGPLPQIVDPSKAVLHLQLPTYDRPVTHDWELQGFSVDDGPEPAQVSMDKCGWLSKRGSMKRLTKWRLRFFVLRHKEKALYYYESETAQKPKGTINLKFSRVELADDMNRKFTTFTVTKGTRKEMQTWCFKVSPFGSSREYVIEARTKQERQEWMDAIYYVTVSIFDASCTITDPSDAENQFCHDSPPDLRVGDGALETFTSGFKSGSNSTRGDSLDLRTDRSNSSANTGGMEDIDLIWSELMHIIETDPLYEFNSLDISRVWRHRYEFIESPIALPRLLKCVNWMNKFHAAEASTLMQQWTPPGHRASYIQLLDADFADRSVRSFAVSHLRGIPPATMRHFLPQLVQALKFEPHHASALASMLIQCAIEAPSQLGFEFFWCMKVESHNERYQERFSVLLNSYLDACGQRQRSILKLQDKLFSADGIFARICRKVKSRKKDGLLEMKRTLHNELRLLNNALPVSFQLPIDPRIEVGQIIVEKCKVMDSAKLPLWLVFENAEPGGEHVTVIFKAGDDVRQDCLTLQLIRLMDEIWRENGIDLDMDPYRCVATSPMTGILQVVPNSATTADIQRRYGGRAGPLYRNSSFSTWIQENNPDESKLMRAKDLYLRSVAGYCVATFVLGIGDRHNDNIMIASNGRYFHIDFGHFLNYKKYHLGFKRERSAFVFTKEMAHPMGGIDSEDFKKFVHAACSAYTMLRPHMHLFVSLLSLMIPAGMPELSSKDDLNYVVDSLSPELSESDAYKKFADEISCSLKDKYKSIDDFLHLVKHG